MDIQPAYVTEKVLLDYLFLNLFKAAAATTELHLYQNNYTPGLGTVKADFTEADFDGYAEIVIPGWTVPLYDPVSGEPYNTPLTTTVFTDTGAATPNTIYGWYMLDAVGGQLMGCQRFDTPVVMDANLKTIALAIYFRLVGPTGKDAYED